MKLLQITIFALLMSVLTITSCSVDEPDVPNEEEVITTLRYTLTPTNSGNEVVFEFQDLDGDGGNTPIIINDTLAANTTYTGTLELLNEAENPVEDVTIEVKEEAELHQFFYATTVNGLTINYSDTDANNNPIGLATSVNTAAATNGTLTITLRHEPNKSGTNVASGDITNAGGETDIEVTFDVEVQ